MVNAAIVVVSVVGGGVVVLFRFSGVGHPLLGSSFAITMSLIMIFSSGRCLDMVLLDLSHCSEHVVVFPAWLHRLSAAYTPAEKYVKSFMSPVLAIVAR